MKKMAILRIAPDSLRQILNLPDGAELVRAEMEPGFRGVIRLMVEGVGWETPEGFPVMPATSPVVTETWADGELTRRDILWNLPG